MALLTVDQLIERYGEKAVLRAAKAACQAVAHHVVNACKVYPPATESNRPGRWTTNKAGYPRAMGYYERGRGYWHPIMQKKTLYNRGRLGKSRGSIAAPTNLRPVVAGYRLRMTSERLRDKWTVQVLSNGARVVNAATYSRLVQDEQMQTALHAAHGWGTVQQAIARAAADNIAGDAVMQQLESGR